MTKAAELAKMGEVLTNSQIGGRRNMIINGAMQVAQRGTQVTGNTSGGYVTVDRFAFSMVSREEAVFTIDQASDAPAGFTKSFKITTTTAESAIDAADAFWVEQKLEGQDVTQLKNGSSDAEKVTLSFYVKSSVTGTFGLSLYKGDNTGRIINVTYSISAANTWERKVITFDGDTSGGGIDDDNTEGFRVVWHLASGSDYDSVNSTSWANYSSTNWAGGHAQDGVITTTNATWQLTGVQLEVGSQATPFEHRSFGEELALCQRYFEKSFNAVTTPGTTGQAGVISIRQYSTNAVPSIFYKQAKRASATMTIYSAATGASGKARDNDGAADITIAILNNGETHCTVVLNGTDANYLHFHYTADAEL